MANKKIYERWVVLVSRPEGEAPVFEKLEIDGESELTESEAKAENEKTAQNGLLYILKA